MKLLGHRTWWAPAPLARLHRRIGLHEDPAPPDAGPQGTVEAPPALAEA